MLQQLSVPHTFFISSHTVQTNFDTKLLEKKVNKYDDSLDTNANLFFDKKENRELANIRPS